MPIDPQILKQLKSGSLERLSVQQIYQAARHHIEEKDWKILRSHVATAAGLKEIDMTSAHGSFEHLIDGIKQNKSIVKLNLTQIVNDYHAAQLADVLAAGHIRELNLSHCHVYPEDQGGSNNLPRALADNPTLTHFTMTGTQPQMLAPFIKALLKSPNILSCTPDNPSLTAVIAANKKAAAALADTAKSSPGTLTEDELKQIRARLPAITHFLETTHKLDRKGVAEVFLHIEDRANRLGTDFVMPDYYKEIADWLPLPFHASKSKVVFTASTTLDAATLYKAAEAGQVDELLAQMRAQGKKITAAHCLFKPAGKEHNLVQLIARQSKLSEVMSVANWTGDPRGLREAATTVPDREWRRQMKEMPLVKLISLVNAATLKQKRPRGPKPG